MVSSLSRHDVSHSGNPVARAVLIGGLAAAVLDAIDAVVAYKVVLGFDPIPIYQFVASGLLGPSAFEGGVATALVGLAVHFTIAFSAAGVFVATAARWPGLARSFVASGAVFGAGVWAVMNLIVIPLSRIPASPFSMPLFVNGVLGHMALVGVPIAYVARRYLRDAEAREVTARVAAGMS